MAASGMIRTGFVLYGTVEDPLDGVAEVEVVETAGGVFLVVGAEAHGAVSVFDITDPGAVVQVSRIDYGPDSGTFVLSDLSLVEVGGTLELLTFGRYDDNVGYYRFGDDGVLGGVVSLADPGGLFTGSWLSETVVIGGVTYLYTAQFGLGGISWAEIGSGGVLDASGRLEDRDTWKLGDVTALEYAYLHGQHILFAGSAFDSGLHALGIRSTGALRNLDKITPREGEGFARITDIAEVEIGDRSFIIVAGSQSDTLTVFRVSAGIKLNVVDQVRDTKEMRLEGVQAIEVFEADGRVFVIAAGADDGVSLFEMDYRGRLTHLETLADDFDTTLRNISSLAVRVEGTTAYVYVGSSAEHGVTELIIDLVRDGRDMRGGPVPDHLVGTGRDDIIWGMGRSDVIEGRGGDDRLIDGRGRDTLIGGNGADVFVFIDDGRSDFILDFKIGVDKIDLSDFEGINHIDDLTIGSRKQGAVIIVGDEVIRLVDPDGQPIDVSGLDEDSFIFG